MRRQKFKKKFTHPAIHQFCTPNNAFLEGLKQSQTVIRQRQSGITFSVNNSKLPAKVSVLLTEAAWAVRCLPLQYHARPLGSKSLGCLRYFSGMKLEIGMSSRSPAQPLSSHPTNGSERTPASPVA